MNQSTKNQIIVQAAYQLATANQYRVFQKHETKKVGSKMVDTVVWFIAKDGDCRAFSTFEQMADQLGVFRLLNVAKSKDIKISFGEDEISGEWMWTAITPGQIESFEDIRDLRHFVMMFQSQVEQAQPSSSTPTGHRPSFVKKTPAQHGDTFRQMLPFLLGRAKAISGERELSSWELRKETRSCPDFPSIEECRRINAMLAAKEQEKKRQRLEERDRLIRWFQERSDCLQGVAHVG